MNKNNKRGITKHGISFACGLLAIAALTLVSCNSGNDVPTVKENELPEAIANDFNSRCVDNTIEHVYSGSDFYQHGTTGNYGLFQGQGW